MTEEVRPARCTLFLACTRPALFVGIPLEAVFFCLLGGVLGGPVLSGDMVLVLPIAGVMGAVCRLVSKHDPLVFRVLLAWLESRPKGAVGAPMNSRKWWGGHSISPLRPTLQYTRAELGRNV